MRLAEQPLESFCEDRAAGHWDAADIGSGAVSQRREILVAIKVGWSTICVHPCVG